ncbi:tetratricopeptide (TPR) repeat protein [Archangium gephyra]|nr:tetratricopeptide repeat protein [Archangium gephyra]REG24498.1 tetratricopeptide (TPR) repeat protein [Archangium gephyra]
MSAAGESSRGVHVVILTAITLEYRAAKQVEAGAWPGSRWEEQRSPQGLPVVFRTFQGKGGRPLRVAIAQAGEMGAVAATNALLPLVDAYRPQCVAMSGVCAGRRGKTNLGDVVAAERLFFHDAGKKLPDGVLGDLKTYNLRDDWKVALEQFDFTTRFREEPWWKTRPVPYEWQENWVLARLHEGVADPSALPECQVLCPKWESVIDSLWKSGHVQDGMLTLTDEGRKRIGRLLIQHRNRLPGLSPSGELLPFKVHVAPMGSGTQVIEDETVWSFISAPMRKTLGLEMEAAALGMLAHAQRERKLDALVLKGVMDFADAGRDDHFKEFAARASAECLLAFLREHLDVEVVPGIDDLLVPGTEWALPEVPPPSALLHARYEVVPFHERGREAILAELERWCDEGPPVAGRLLHAEGGVGKTRLAIEWTRRRRAAGWEAGFLPKDVPGDWFERLWMRGQPVLVVIDYAESRTDLSAILSRVHRYSQQAGAGVLRRMRLLLLARGDGDWWQSLRQSDTSLGAWLEVTPPHELAPLAVSAAEREKVFQEAAEKFAEKRGKRYVPRALVPFTDERFARVLYLHMAALASVEELAFEANTLLDVILDHEEHFWAAHAQQGDLVLARQRSLARQVIAAATLRGGFASASELSLVTRRLLGRSLSASEEELLLLLQRIYQGTGGDSAVYLPALEPDLLGEGMVLRVASPKLQADRPPTDWIDRVFPPDEQTLAVGAGLGVLGRASASRPDVVRPWIERLLAGPLHSRAVLALEAAKAVGLRTELSVLGDALADRLEAEGDVRLAFKLGTATIPMTVSLSRVAEWTTRTLVQALPASGDVRLLTSRAGLLGGRGRTLTNLGRYEEALKVTREAVGIRRTLAESDPAAFQADLAESLNDLGNALLGLGRHEEALAAAREAVELLRPLAQRDPYAFQGHLAASLGNMGNMLGELGRYEEALAAIQDAVEFMRPLAQRDPDTFRSSLAMGLNNLGTALGTLGRTGEALAAMEEAVRLYRPLAQHNPDAYRPDLARSLSNIGALLDEDHRHDEALSAVEEAVGLYRPLAERNPEAFGSGLSSSLNNLGSRLSKLGRHEEALEAVREAIAIRRTLAHSNPAAFQPDLAQSLYNQGHGLRVLGRHEEALPAIREAIGLLRPLAERHPDAFQDHLAQVLGSLATSLTALGRDEEALKALHETVVLYRSLMQRKPDAFQGKLIQSLSELGLKLEALGRSEESLVTLEEAMMILSPLVRRGSDDFWPTFAEQLSNLSTALSSQGRHEGALPLMEEAIQLYRPLAQRDPDTFQPELAVNLGGLGTALSKLGRHDEALAATEEALDALWPFFERRPSDFAQRTAVLIVQLLDLYTSLARAPVPSFQERLVTFKRLMEA